MSYQLPLMDFALPDPSKGLFLNPAPWGILTTTSMMQRFSTHYLHIHLQAHLLLHLITCPFLSYKHVHEAGWKTSHFERLFFALVGEVEAKKCWVWIHSGSQTLAIWPAMGSITTELTVAVL